MYIQIYIKKNSPPTQLITSVSGNMKCRRMAPYIKLPFVVLQLRALMPFGLPV